MVESWDDPPSGVKKPYAGSPKLHFELVTGPTCKGMHCNISKKVSEVHLGVSLNGGIPKTRLLGTTLLGNAHLALVLLTDRKLGSPLL